MPDDVQQRKKTIRAQAHAHRHAQLHKDELSKQIFAKFVALPEYAAAHTVMYYVDVRSEVRTRHALPTALTHANKRMVIPYCVADRVELFWLRSMEELSIGRYQILEPKIELRALAERRLQPADLDLILVPGVAFDRRGARMGHGFGYYDKLLEHARADAPLVALAFECQLFPELPTAPHDIFMDKIITEQAVYVCRGRT
jgi:5-formyltetrahydrofolate cyclo-ligase